MRAAGIPHVPFDDLQPLVASFLSPVEENEDNMGVAEGMSRPFLQAPPKGSRLALPADEQGHPERAPVLPQPSGRANRHRKAPRRGSQARRERQT